MRSRQEGDDDDEIELIEAGCINDDIDERFKSFFKEVEDVREEMLAIRDALAHLHATNKGGKVLA